MSYLEENQMIWILQYWGTDNILYHFYSFKRCVIYVYYVYRLICIKYIQEPMEARIVSRKP